VDVALSTLVNMMEVNRKDFVVILSGSDHSRSLNSISDYIGYTREMEKLFTANPGLR
jgi:hypothetical protein